MATRSNAARGLTIGVLAVCLALGMRAGAQNVEPQGHFAIGELSIVRSDTDTILVIPLRTARLGASGSGLRDDGSEAPSTELHAALEIRRNGVLIDTGEITIGDWIIEGRGCSVTRFGACAGFCEGITGPVGAKITRTFNTPVSSTSIELSGTVQAGCQEVGGQECYPGGPKTCFTCECVRVSALGNVIANAQVPLTAGDVLTVTVTPAPGVQDPDTTKHQAEIIIPGPH